MKSTILSINKNAVFQYFSIYLMIQYIGGRIPIALGGKTFNALITFICLIYIAKHKNKRRLEKKYIRFLILIFLSLFMTVIYTVGDLSIGTLLSILGRFLIVYVAIIVDRNEFIRRFLKLSFILCFVSLITYLLTIKVGIGPLNPIISRLYKAQDIGGFTVSYGLFLFVFNVMDLTRNSGIFGEPGEFQMLVNTALFFIVFKANTMNRKLKIKYTLIFFITLMTIQSTTGFFSFVAFVLACLFQSSKKIDPWLRNLVVVCFAGVLVYMAFFATQDSFIYTKFFNKFMVDNNTINFNQGTGEDRVASIDMLNYVINNHPSYVIFGIGYSGFEKFIYSATGCAGIISGLLMLGLTSYLIIYGYMLKTLCKYSGSIMEVFLVVFMIINNGLSQPDILQIVSVLLCFYGLLLHEKSDESLKSNVD